MNVFHVHDVDQVLYVTAGEGIIATETEEITIRPGDFVVIPAGEKHWHGATPELGLLAHRDIDEGQDELLVLCWARPLQFSTGEDTDPPRVKLGLPSSSGPRTSRSLMGMSERDARGPEEHEHLFLISGAS